MNTCHPEPSRKKRHSGFTLIELVVVIVILGILAATALPKFIDISNEARTAATAGIAGSLGSSSAINFSTSLAKGAVMGASVTSPTPATTTGILNTTTGCTNAIATSLVPSLVFDTLANKGQYSVSGPATAATYANIGDYQTCTVTNNSNTAVTGTFLLYDTL